MSTRPAAERAHFPRVKTKTTSDDVERIGQKETQLRWRRDFFARVLEVRVAWLARFAATAVKAERSKKGKIMLRPQHTTPAKSVA